MTLDDIKALPVADLADDKAQLYLWVPNALLPDGLAVMEAWGFEYKSNIVWEKTRKDGMPDGRGVGFYFRNVTELLLFGIKKKSAPNRTLAPARSQVNLIRAMKREHSRKPDEFIPLIEACSQAPRIELFARGDRDGWDMWGNQAAVTGAAMPGIDTLVKCEISGLPAASKATTQMRRFVPPASSTMTGLPTGTGRPREMYDGIIARELAAPARPADISDEKSARSFSASMAAAASPWRSIKERMAFFMVARL